MTEAFLFSLSVSFFVVSLTLSLIALTIRAGRNNPRIRRRVTIYYILCLLSLITTLYLLFRMPGYEPVVVGLELLIIAAASISGLFCWMVLMSLLRASGSEE